MGHLYTPKGKVSKFGYIGDIDAAGGGEEVWIVEGAYTGFVAAAAATTAVSSSTNDTSDGTGARTIKVLGLIDVDGVWTEVEETVTLNGTTAVDLTNDFIRVYRTYVVTAGTGVVNAGNIDIKHDTVVLARVGTGYGQTLQACYTIPNVLLSGETISQAAFLRWYATIGAVQDAFAVVAVQTKASGGAWRTRRLCGIGEGGWMEEHLDEAPEILPSKTDIRIRVIYCGANNSAIAAGFDMEMW